jgi:hypothetical protein
VPTATGVSEASENERGALRGECPHCRGMAEVNAKDAIVECRACRKSIYVEEQDGVAHFYDAERRTRWGACLWLKDRFNVDTYQQLPHEARRQDLVGAFVDIITKLPDEEFKRLDRLNLYVLHTSLYAANSATVPRYVRLASGQVGCGTDPEAVRCWFVFFRHDVDEQPYQHLVAEVAHELGHAALGHGIERTPSEFEACAWAITAGFKPSIVAWLLENRSVEERNESWAECIGRLDELQAMEPDQ